MMLNIRLFIVALLALSPLSAFAYVDPGSGMLLWQGLLAAVGAALMFIRRPWEALKRFIDRFRNK